MDACNLTACAAPNVRSAWRAPNLAALMLAVAGAVLLVLPAAGLAKDKKPDTRTVLGTVFDPAQNTIDGATVELTDQQTGKVLDIYSEGGGKYQYTDLRFDHDYTVKATFKGVSSEVRKVSILETRSPLVLNLTIPNSSQ